MCLNMMMIKWITIITWSKLCLSDMSLDDAKCVWYLALVTSTGRDHNLPISKELLAPTAALLHSGTHWTQIFVWNWLLRLRCFTCCCCRELSELVGLVAAGWKNRFWHTDHKICFLFSVLWLVKIWSIFINTGAICLFLIIWCCVYSTWVSTYCQIKQSNI